MAVVTGMVFNVLAAGDIVYYIFDVKNKKKNKKEVEYDENDSLSC